MPDDGRYDLLAAFLAVRGDALLRTAVLLAPGREAGEDLLQEAPERLLRKWAFLSRCQVAEAGDGLVLRYLECADLIRCGAPQPPRTCAARANLNCWQRSLNRRP